MPFIFFKSFWRAFWLESIYVIAALAIASWFITSGWNANTFLESFFVEAVSILVTVGIIETLNKRRAENQRTEQLISQLSSPFEGFAIEALRLLRVDQKINKLSGRQIHMCNLSKGDLHKASITGAEFSISKFEDANLSGANLTSLRSYDSIYSRALFEATTLVNSTFQNSLQDNFFFRDCRMNHANLTGARFFYQLGDRVMEDPYPQLAACTTLRRAVMPNGDLYDGRLRLPGDLAHADGLGLDLNNVDLMAHFYGVTPQQYEIGQQWYEQSGIRSIQDLIANTETQIIDFRPGIVLDMPGINT